MPDPFKFPGMRRAIVPLMCAGFAVVLKVIADRLPRFSSVVGPLNRLSVPISELGRIDPIWIGGRAIDMKNFPAAELRPVNSPVFSLCVAGQDEGAFGRANQYSNPTHRIAFQSCGIRPHSYHTICSWNSGESQDMKLPRWNFAAEFAVHVAGQWGGLWRRLVQLLLQPRACVPTQYGVWVLAVGQLFGLLVFAHRLAQP